MEKIGSQILEHLKNPGALNPVLAAAGASGLLGGVATAGTARRRGETPGQRRLRILRNALLAAGAGGGAVALGSYGLRQGQNALPVDDVDPVKKLSHGNAARGGLGLTSWLTLNRGAGDVQQAAQAELQKKLLTQGRAGMDPAAFAKLKSVGLEGALKDTHTAPLVREFMATKMLGPDMGNPEKLMQNELRHAGLPVHSAGVGQKASEVATKNFLERQRHRFAGWGKPILTKTPTGMRGLPNAAKAAITLAAILKGPEAIGAGAQFVGDMAGKYHD